MVLVFTDKYTPRVKYIFEQIFKEILHVDISFTTKEQVAIDSTIPVICYSREHRIPKSFVIEPEGLLFKKGIKDIQPEVTEWNGTKIFFHMQSDKKRLKYKNGHTIWLLVGCRRYSRHLKVAGRNPEIQGVSCAYCTQRRRST